MCQVCQNSTGTQQDVLEGLGSNRNMPHELLQIEAAAAAAAAAAAEGNRYNLEGPNGPLRRSSAHPFRGPVSYRTERRIVSYQRCPKKKKKKKKKKISSVLIPLL